MEREPENYNGLEKAQELRLSLDRKEHGVVNSNSPGSVMKGHTRIIKVNCEVITNYGDCQEGIERAGRPQFKFMTVCVNQIMGIFLPRHKVIGGKDNVELRMTMTAMLMMDVGSQYEDMIVISNQVVG